MSSLVTLDTAVLNKSISFTSQTMVLILIIQITPPFLQNYNLSSLLTWLVGFLGKSMLPRMRSYDMFSRLAYNYSRGCEELPNKKTDNIEKFQSEKSHLDLCQGELTIAIIFIQVRKKKTTYKSVCT